MSPEPERVVLQLLREMRAELSDMRAEMATRLDLDEVRSDMRSLRADVAADLVATRKELSEQIVGLRRAVSNITLRSSGMGSSSASSRRASVAWSSI
jgi:hypothetical protein